MVIDGYSRTMATQERWLLKNGMATQERYGYGNRWLLKNGIAMATDGYSRTVTVLECADNNRAETVLSFFLDAIGKYRVPLRIRTDHGTENVATARWMLNYLSVANRPVITGLSVHRHFGLTFTAML